MAQLLIEFTDGTTEAVDGTDHRTHEGVLIVRTEHTWGPPTDVRHFPLTNIKSYRWEGRR